jgi:hypothetical protein
MGRRAAECGEPGVFARQAEHMASTRITLYCSSLITPSSLDLLTSSLNHSVFSFRGWKVSCIKDYCVLQYQGLTLKRALFTGDETGQMQAGKMKVEL